MSNTVCASNNQVNPTAQELRFWVPSSLRSSAAGYLERYTALANRLFNIATAVSAVVLCLVVVAWFAAGAIDPRKHFVNLTNGCYLSVNARGADARLQVFNDSSYGPYGGSIIGIAGDPNGPKVSGVGDVAGIYYRMIRWPNGSSLWTLSLSLVYPLLLALPLPIVWLIRRSRRSRRGFVVDGQPAAV